MCAISICSYILPLICLWGVDWGLQVKCRICKWKLLSVTVNRTVLRCFYTAFRDVQSSFFYIVLIQTECK